MKETDDDRIRQMLWAAMREGHDGKLTGLTVDDCRYEAEYFNKMMSVETTNESEVMK